MDVNAIMDLLKTNMQAALPARVVTRSARDPAAYQLDDIKKGVIALVALNIGDLKAPREIADHAGKLLIGVAADLQLAESATGQEVEAAELALWMEVHNFLKAPGLGLCPLDALDVTFSGQTAAPQGWLFARFEYSEID
jgi:hypothetical protein